MSGQYPRVPAAAPLAPYDVLQVQDGGAWLDFATIRSQADGLSAWEWVTTGGRGTHRPGVYRIVRPGRAPFPLVIAEALCPGTQGEHAPRCSLCRCAAVARLFGFAVCPHHCHAGEDGPACPSCTTRRDCPELTEAEERSLSPLQAENERRARRTRRDGGRA